MQRRLDLRGDLKWMGIGGQVVTCVVTGDAGGQGRGDARVTRLMGNSVVVQSCRVAFRVVWN